MGLPGYVAASTRKSHNYVMMSDSRGGEGEVLHYINFDVMLKSAYPQIGTNQRIIVSIISTQSANRNFDVVVIHKVNLLWISHFPQQAVPATDSSALVIYYLNKKQCVLMLKPFLKVTLD